MEKKIISLYDIIVLLEQDCIIQLEEYEFNIFKMQSKGKVSIGYANNNEWIDTWEYLCYFTNINIFKNYIEQTTKFSYKPSYAGSKNKFIFYKNNGYKNGI